MSAEEVPEDGDSRRPTCPWCDERIESDTDSVEVGPPDRRSPAHTWDLHVDCAAEWREFVAHLRTLAGRGAFRTLVEGPLSGSVGAMVEWSDRPG